VKLNIENIVNVLKDVRDYVFPAKKISNKFRSISSIQQLESFIQERSAHVTQTTLYGYIKTRIGTRYAIMIEDEKFLESINIAKWNIYIAALSDCTLYTFSFLTNKKNLKTNDSEKVFFSILDKEKKNGLDLKLYENAKIEFVQRLKEVDWINYYHDKPFQRSGDALYHWSPIADELKKLDKEIVLNSISLKWNIVKNEFDDLTKDLKFN
jgi:hypothetical protein